MAASAPTSETGDVELLEQAGLVAVVRGRSAEDAVGVSEALADGGVRAIEVAFTTPQAAAAIAALVERLAGCAVVGAGTIVSRSQADAAIAAGAAFLVSPGFDADVVEHVHAAGREILPGVATATEVMAATRHGVRALKLFPGSLGGPDYLRALRGPFPDVRFMPTGGVSLATVPEWLGAGAFAVGVGGRLAPSLLRDDDDRAAVAAAARAFVDAVDGWRSARETTQVAR
jgi:2-dehydro-3-deoxyphosphogluconate aldolase/(4S)-4-hydroxy-2-oxoglutarate aldolase